MKKNIIAIVCILFLSSCTGNSQPAQSKETKELIVWSLYTPTDVMSGPLEEYESLYGVDITYKTFTNEKEYEDLLLNQLAAGKGPDIFMLKNTWLSKHSDKVVPFDQSFTSYTLTPDVYETTYFQTAFQDLVTEGQIYGVPLTIDSLGLYYNKQVFKDGSSYPYPQPTWEGVLSQAQELTRSSTPGSFTRSGISIGSLTGIQSGLDVFSTLLLQYGAEVYNGRSITLTSQKVIDPVTEKSINPFESTTAFFYSFIDPSNDNYQWSPNITANTTAKERELFVQGKIAMIPGYAYLYDELLRIRQRLERSRISVMRESDIAVSAFPQLQNPNETISKSTLALYYPFFVSMQSPNPDFAWDLLLFLSEKERVMDISKKLHMAPSRYDAAAEIDLGMFQPFVEQAQYARSFPPSPIEDSWLLPAFLQTEVAYTKRGESLSSALRLAQTTLDCLLEGQKNYGQNEESCY